MTVFNRIMDRLILISKKKYTFESRHEVRVNLILTLTPCPSPDPDPHPHPDPDPHPHPHPSPSPIPNPNPTQAILAPYDYFEFGQEYVKPLVNFESSYVRSMQPPHPSPCPYP